MKKVMTYISNLWDNTPNGLKVVIYSGITALLTAISIDLLAVTPQQLEAIGVDPVFRTYLAIIIGMLGNVVAWSSFQFADRIKTIEAGK